MNANNERANEGAATNPANGWDRLVTRVIEPFDRNVGSVEKGVIQ